jgi:hypothetical protein
MMYKSEFMREQTGRLSPAVAALWCSYCSAGAAG